MKKISLLFIFHVFFGFSQKNSGVIIYKSFLPTVNKIDSTKISPQIYQDMKGMIQSVEKLEFKLTFNEEYSKFQMIDLLESDNDNNGFRLAKIFYGNNIFYCDFKNNYFVRAHQKTYVKIDEVVEWILLDDKKTINGYDCYKAIYHKKFITREEKEANREVIAWYCPTFPVRLSPENYGGLPGIVMELNTGLIVYVAKAIKFSEEKKNVDFPDKKLISEEDYDLKLKDNFLIKN